MAHNEREFLAYYYMFQGNPSWPQMNQSMKTDFYQYGLEYLVPPYNFYTIYPSQIFEMSNYIQMWNIFPHK